MFSTKTFSRLLDSPLVQSIALYCLAALMIIGLAGCGDAAVPTGTVSGTVEFSGNPYGNVQLILLSMETGNAGSAEVNSDGVFNLEDSLPVGEYVAYFAPSATPAEGEQPAPVTIDQSIPDSYWNESTSGLRVKVDEGSNKVGLVIE